jgi:hypothetical protein
MYNLKIVIVVIVFCFSCKLNGQEINNRRTINWKLNQLFYSPYNDDSAISKSYLLFFDNAVFLHELNDLPFYYELIPVNGVNYDLVLENQMYEPVNSSELQDVKGLHAISSTLYIQTKIVHSKKKSFIQLIFNPIRKDEISGEVQKLLSFDIRIIEKTGINQKKSLKKDFSNSSVLKTGKWVKIIIDKSGVYKITFDQLRALGIENPESTRIFGNGGKMLPVNNNELCTDDLIENKVLFQNNAVYFYGEGPIKWEYDMGRGFFTHQKHLYSNYSWYFISSDYNSSFNQLMALEEQSQNAENYNINTFIDYAFHEVDKSNLIHSGKLWCGEEFDLTTEYEFNFSFQNIVPNSNVKLKSSLLTRSPLPSSFTIELNNQSLNSNFSAVNYNYTSTYANQNVEIFQGNSINSSNVNVRLRYNKSSASSQAWLDYLTLNVQRNLIIGTNQLQFRNTESVGIGNTSLFTIGQATSQLQVWDITNRQKPRRINASLNGTDLSFRVNTDTLREFVAFTESMVYTPILSGDEVGLVQNQNLHGIEHVDMVIVCHPKFYEHAIALKQIHEENDNLSVVVITNQQLYNEFSSGMPDIGALRNFMRMLYKRATNQADMPKYLCLFGDGSFDNLSGSGVNSNFILTYQSENSLNPTQSFVTDDFYGLLDDDEGGHEGLLDIGIGRLPVKTTAEASDAINKIRNYINISSYGNWRNNICFIADDEDYNTHISQADELSKYVKSYYPEFNIEKVYLDAFVQHSTASGQRYPDANIKINNLISRGLLLLNYTGHGNERQLAEEVILSVDQINKFDNLNKLAVFMTATCEFSRFDNYNRTTAGELAFLNPKGVAVALYTTTRLVYASPNFELNQNFYKYIFENDISTGRQYSLGDVMMLTKNASGSGINKRNFTLLGDPALKLSYGQLKISTTMINDSLVNGTADTIKAYQKVTIKGEVQDGAGTRLSGYNGIVFPIVFDKKQDVKTLDNDGQGSFNYSVINSPVFKGKASINNGEFQFTFIVPKDIRYNVDTGKISYYSSNYKLLEDAKGSFANFFIGGVSNNNSTDKIGPEVKIYLNDEKFVNGGITNKNPKLLVYLSDSSGINTSGNGIGHDIVASIDNNNDLKFIVNDYYESDKDDYKNGKINFNLPELSEGEHKLKLKAWDVFNNSSEDSLFFVVAESEKLQISHVLNYPNPFSTNTLFFFEHNRPNEPLDVLIQIYSASGKVIKTIQSQVISGGFRIDGIQWDGRDDYGNKPGRGVYFYKLSVKTIQGEKTNKTEKLLILN